MSKQCQIKIIIVCYVCVLWILVVSTNIPYDGHSWSNMLNVVPWHTITWNIYTWVPLSRSTTSCHTTRGFLRLRSISRLSFFASHMWTSTHAHEGEHQGITTSWNQLITIINTNISKPHHEHEHGQTQMLSKNLVKSKMKPSPTSRQRCPSPLILLKPEHQEQSYLYNQSKKSNQQSYWN